MKGPDSREALLAAENPARRSIAARLNRARKNAGWYGTGMLFRREIKRFMNIFLQTIGNPVFMTIIYFAVFGYSLGGRVREVAGIPYIDFIVPGLVMLAVITNSFLNAGFSFFIGKVHGTIVDLLVTPLSPAQIMAGFGGAALVRGLLTGGMIWLIAGLLGARTLHDPALALLFMVLTSLSFGLFGLCTAILAEDFEHINFLPNFVVMPLTFLGGVFYSTEMLPEPWATILHLNPIFYLVNGFRYGMTGVSDVSVGLGLSVAVAMTLGFFLIGHRLLATGRKLRE